MRILLFLLVVFGATAPSFAQVPCYVASEAAALALARPEHSLDQVFPTREHYEFARVVRAAAQRVLGAAYRFDAELADHVVVRRLPTRVRVVDTRGTAEQAQPEQVLARLAGVQTDLETLLAGEGVPHDWTVLAADDRARVESLIGQLREGFKKSREYQDLKTNFIAGAGAYVGGWAIAGAGFLSIVAGSLSPQFTGAWSWGLNMAGAVGVLGGLTTMFGGAYYAFSYTADFLRRWGISLPRLKVDYARFLDAIETRTREADRNRQPWEWFGFTAGGRRLDVGWVWPLSALNPMLIVVERPAR